MDPKIRKDYSTPQMETIGFDHDDLIMTSLDPDETKPRFSPSGKADLQDIDIYGSY